MKTFIISALSALSTAGAINVATIGAAAAQTGGCLSGDTMDRDGGRTGALGASKCDGSYAQRNVIQTNRAAA